MSKVINQLSEIIKEKNLSMFEIGKQTKMSRATVGRMLTGESSPSLDKLEKVVEFLGYEIILKKKNEK